jgi:hypothetical protein
VSGSPAGGRQGVRGERKLALRLEGFAWEAIEEQSASLGVSVEDFIAFSTLYYLADLDSGRIARQITRSPYPDAS